MTFGGYCMARLHVVSEQGHEEGGNKADEYAPQHAKCDASVCIDSTIAFWNSPFLDISKVRM
jgi:hypothetical protein